MPSSACDWSSDVCSRSEEHTSELQSHSEISYAVFCLKKKIYNSGSYTPDGILKKHTERFESDWRRTCSRPAAVPCFLPGQRLPCVAGPVSRALPSGNSACERSYKASPVNSGPR